MAMQGKASAWVHLKSSSVQMCLEFNIHVVCSISLSWVEIGNAALALLKRLLGTESLGVTLCIQPPAKYLIEP